MKQKKPNTPATSFPEDQVIVRMQSVDPLTWSESIAGRKLLRTTIIEHPVSVEIIHEYDNNFIFNVLWSPSTGNLVPKFLKKKLVGVTNVPSNAAQQEAYDQESEFRSSDQLDG